MEFEVKRGDIFSLGNHRLMCGDATNVDDVKKLIDGETVNLCLTDPPYGMKVQKGDGRIGGKKHFTGGLRETVELEAKTYSHIIGDNSQETARKHYEIIKNFTKYQIFWGGQYFAHFLPVSGGWIFWDKKMNDNDFSDGELAWTNKGKRLRKYEFLWNGVCREGNYFYNPKPRLHPSQKPVELHMQILEDFTKYKDTVIDCFAGSGTTLIACNETGRKCLAMELSTEYVKIIIDRYKTLTNERVIKIS
ncbi:MAG: site-specific DNA-methyltransferase [Synergistaceae bacterium]|nr:site-specific DNA-methyltransferase [Synergistaceae bacterium]